MIEVMFFVGMCVQATLFVWVIDRIAKAQSGTLALLLATHSSDELPVRRRAARLGQPGSGQPGSGQDRGEVAQQAIAPVGVKLPDGRSLEFITAEGQELLAGLPDEVLLFDAEENEEPHVQA